MGTWEIEQMHFKYFLRYKISLFVIPPMCILSLSSHISSLVLMFCYTVTVFFYFIEEHLNS